MSALERFRRFLKPAGGTQTARMLPLAAAVALSAQAASFTVNNTACVNNLQSGGGSSVNQLQAKPLGASGGVAGFSGFGACQVSGYPAGDYASGVAIFSGINTDVTVFNDNNTFNIPVLYNFNFESNLNLETVEWFLDFYIDDEFAGGDYGSAAPGEDVKGEFSIEALQMFSTFQVQLWFDGFSSSEEGENEIPVEVPGPPPANPFLRVNIPEGSIDVNPPPISSEVPEPGAVLLVCSGLAAGALLRRRS